MPRLLNVSGVTLVADTREHKEHLSRIVDPLAQYGVRVERKALKTGDYMLAGRPNRVVEHKKSLEEICANVTRGHNRFRRELIRALEAGIHLVILIEDPVIRTLDDVKTWINPRTPYSPKCVQGAQLFESLKTIRDRYGVEIRFCKPEETGRTIIALLMLPVNV